MPVIAVVNRKGGSGKSTLAAHVAAWSAGQGLPVILGDVDRQQSTQAWLKRRAAHPAGRRARLYGWSVDPRNVVRPPANAGLVVLDTPGGLRGFDLARVVMYADAILMPVCNSVFDRESAAECVAELRKLPRVASGRCRLAAVGMRIDARTKAEEVLVAWAGSIDLPFLGVLRDTQAYVRCIEDGLTLFDLPPTRVAQDLVQWQPIVHWLAPLALPAREAAAAGPAGMQASEALQTPAHETAHEASHARVAAASADVAAHPSHAASVTPASSASTRQRPADRVVPESTARAAPVAVDKPATNDRAPSSPATVRRLASVPATAPRGSTPVGRLLNALAIPRFLQRTP
jgi:chromosome partitioning protein